MMKQNNIYIGSSLSIVFQAKDENNQDLDITSYEKKITAVSENRLPINLEFEEISSSSFSVKIDGSTTKRIGSGRLSIIVELKKDNDTRIGKACPVTLVNPKSSGCCSDSIAMDNGCINTTMTIVNPAISFDLIMGSTIINQGGGSGGEIPTKLSQLENDEGFITSEDIPALPSKLSEFDNDTDFITENDIPSIPAKTSDLVNDSHFITASAVPASNQSFIDLWNTLCGAYGRYNTITGYFELNGFTDIPYAEALQIYSNTSGLRIFDLANNYRPSYTVRTNLPLIYSHNGGAAWNFTNTFGFPAPFEVLNLCCLTRDQFGNVNTITTNTFQSPSLRKVIGRLMVVSTSATALTGTNTFLAPKLEEIFLNLSSFKPTDSATIAFGSLEFINLDSLAYLVSTYSHTQILTVKVHQAVYNKLTNSASYPEWANLVTTALAKNITFAL